MREFRLTAPILLLTFCLSCVALAQDKPQEDKTVEGNIPAIIPVKTLSGDSFDRLAKMLSVFNVKYVADNKLRTILVYAPPPVVEQMRSVVKELDRPGSEAAIGRNIEMTMTFLRCSTKPLSEEHVQIPADMESVTRQLRSATQYKNVEVWYTLPLRLQEGKETNQSFFLPASAPELPLGQGSVDMLPEAVIRKDSGRYLRFDRLRINARIAYTTGNRGTGFQFQFADVGLKTAGDFLEGQKAVLGKMATAEQDSAVFVVISLRFLD